MDSLCKDMGNPSFLLDGVISTGQFCDWIDTHEEQKTENTLWEMYLHKIGAWDDRSFNEFKSDILRGQSLKPVERPSDEQISATVKSSYGILNGFQPAQEGVD